jgi:hypothetical protein
MVTSRAGLRPGRVPDIAAVVLAFADSSEGTREGQVYKQHESAQFLEKKSHSRHSVKDNEPQGLPYQTLEKTPNIRERKARKPIFKRIPV